MRDLSQEVKLLWVVIVAAFVLRALGVFDGLPAVFNPDESHFINTAVYFGGGSFDPPFFKYPTLWMYSLFASFGGLFAGWSCLGLRHSVQDFGIKFATDPSMFYITGRLLAGFVSCAAIWVVFRTALVLWNRRTALTAAALFAFMPAAVDAAHYAKWESLILLTGAAAWYFALRLYRDGRPRNYMLCGLMIGLCVSTHYLAGLFIVLLPLAHIARAVKGDEESLREIFLDGRLWLGLACVPAGFLIGTPYAALDFARFKGGIKDVMAYSAQRKTAVAFSDRLSVLGGIVENALWFSGKSPAFFIFLAAWVALLWESFWLAIMFIGPLFVCTLFLTNQPDGAFVRYIFTSLPALCMLTANGVDKLASKFRRQWAYYVFLAALFLPALADDMALVRERRMQDTRIISGQWIADNIPSGTAILIDQPHASPYLAMSRQQAMELYKRGLESGSARAKYFLYKAKGTGEDDGYRIYQIRRSAADLATMPYQLEKAQETQDLFDLQSGVAGLRAKNIEYVALTSAGIDPYKETQAAIFIKNLRRNASLVADFEPEKRKIKGPSITIYHVE
jgi:uncharacterized membrane protein